MWFEVEFSVWGMWRYQGWRGCWCSLLVDQWYSHGGGNGGAQRGGFGVSPVRMINVPVWLMHQLLSAHHRCSRCEVVGGGKGVSGKVGVEGRGVVKNVFGVVSCVQLLGDLEHRVVQNRSSRGVRWGLGQQMVWECRMHLALCLQMAAVLVIEAGKVGNQVRHVDVG